LKHYNTHAIAYNDSWFHKVLEELPEGRFRNHPWYLPGGADIDPILYGEEVTHTSWFVSEIDAREVALARLLLQERVPMLGICRGHQIITAAFGGTLYQDLWLNEVVTGNHRHREVSVIGDSFLTEIFQGTNQLAGRILNANSLHHQATKDVPSGWRVGALSPDGVIESIYNPLHPQVISVQWHPEMLGQLDTILTYLYQFTR
jgi:putative glutamine amidotransferase